MRVIRTLGGPPSRYQRRNSKAGRIRSSARGQSLVEFALILPILLLLFGGAVQYGFVFTAKNSLTQIARDTARWAATQDQYSPCSSAKDATPPQPVTEADAVARDALLAGYVPGAWHADPGGNFTWYADNTPLPSSPPNSEGVEVVWTLNSGPSCPPTGNSTVAFVTIRLTHAVPVILPGLQFLPAFGTCDASGCHISVTATSMFRMEPPPP